ncbi:MAG TPA: amidohydrolase, partial [Spirochaeta sp.]|nr:amidohydrolase [Spirochaeta sp.]
HPMSLNAIMAMRMLSVNSVKFTFHGVTAHAAADPHNGRSALDAVELMNVGANYLREHITTECRLHYSITNGGGEPNVVPATAQVWYYIRAPRRSDVEEVYGRLKKIAEGAALMTETSFDIEFLSGTHDLMPNDTLGNTMVEALKEVGAPNWDAEDYAYADKITASLQPGMKEGMVKQFGFPPEFAKMTLHDSIMPMLLKSDKVMPGSSDVGDVSYIVPTVFGGMTTSALGSPGHSWQNVAQAGSQIGFKGTIAAAKVMALTALKLIENPEILVKAKEEFQEMTGGKPYKSPLPEGAKAPVHQFEGH